MYCRNCGTENPEGVMICEECGADFSKRIEFSQSTDPGQSATRSSSCLGSLIGYAIVGVIFFAALAALVTFTCFINIPEAPDEGYPVLILSAWEKLDSIQTGRCPELISTEKPIDVEEKADPRVQTADEKEAFSCGQPIITFDPTVGEIGTTFKIMLEGFSGNDQIEACWYFPDETLINCVDLEADENGNKVTKFWSESDDPAGIYTMKAVGSCSQAEEVWEVLKHSIE